MMVIHSKTIQVEKNIILKIMASFVNIMHILNRRKMMLGSMDCETFNSALQMLVYGVYIDA